MSEEMLTEEEKVARAIYALYEIIKDKNFDKLPNVFSNDYTMFGNLPPYHKMDKEESLSYKRNLFSDIVDFYFKITDLDIKIYDDFAIATFNIEYGGIAVYRYSFEGKSVKMKSRCTTLLRKEEGIWKIVHEHISDLP